jgi:hypothetical protein
MADLGTIGNYAVLKALGTLSFPGSSHIVRYKYRTRNSNYGGCPAGKIGVGASIIDSQHEPNRPRQKRRSWRRQIVGETQLNGTPANLRYTLFKDGVPLGTAQSNTNIDLFSLPDGSYEVWIHGNGTKRSETWGPTAINNLAPLEISGTLAACTAGVPYSSGLTATGGKLPLTWGHTGVLPNGLSLNTSTGVISGTATGSPIIGSYKLCITVMTDDGVRYFKDVILVVS